MLKIMEDKGEHQHYNMCTYDADTINEPYFQDISKELIDKAMKHYHQNKTSKNCFIPSDIVNGTQKGMTCYIDVKDDLKEILYHDYLHWCSSMTRDLVSLLITHVSLPQINPHTNQFYRAVYQG